MVGKTGTITADVTSGLGSATITQMKFGSYNTSIATVNPTIVSTAPFATTVTGVAAGPQTAVWATAKLSDGRSCQSSGDTDTQIGVTACPPISNPASITCNVPGNTINWTSVAGADHYPLRVSDTSNPFTTCNPANNLPGNFCGDVSPNSQAFIFGPGKTYNVQAYSVSRCDGSWGTGVAPTIVCQGPPPLVTIQGENVDVDGKPLTKDIGQKITLSSRAFRDGLSYPGSWDFTSIPTGIYTVTAAIPTGYTVSYSYGGINTNSPGNIDNDSYVSGNSLRINLPSDGNWADIWFKYTPIYSISGEIFNDLNNTTGKSFLGLNTAYTKAPVTVVATDASGTISSDINNSTGYYSLNNLADGTYTVTFSVASSDYKFTYPPGNSIHITVGSRCSSDNPSFKDEIGTATNEADCSLGNVENLNAGVTNAADAWIQTTGADIRLDKNNFFKPIPPATYISVPFAPDIPPGVVFTGASTYNGQASATPYDWKVGSPNYPEFFTDTHSNIPTSYTFLVSTAQALNITPTLIYSVDDITNPRIYITSSGGLTIDSHVTFGPGNFVILVNGDLTIKGKITVPVGSTVVFSVKGDIKIDPAVGEVHGTVCDITTPTQTGCDIEGLYSADGEFIAGGDRGLSCPTEDKRLNVAGSVIANAGRQGGAFVNNRSLCADNSTDPSVSFTERPDFMLNYPSFVKQIPRAWQEVAP
jgi:hypothetical protein